MPASNNRALRTQCSPHFDGSNYQCSIECNHSHLKKNGEYKTD